MTKNKISRFLIYFLVLTLPFERLLTLEAFGYTLKLSYFAGLIIIVYSLTLMISQKINPTLYRDELFLFLFGLLAILTTAWSIDWKRSLIISLVTLFMFLIFYFLRRIVDSELRQKVISAVITLGFFVSLFALWQFFADKFGLQGFTYLRPEYQSGVFSFARVQSTFLEPLYLANFLLIPIFFAIYTGISNCLLCHCEEERRSNLSIKDCHASRFTRWLAMTGGRLWLISLITAIAFFLTMSRGAILALAAGVILTFLLIQIFQKEKLSAFLKSILPVVAGFGLAIMFVFAVSGRTGIKEYSGHTTFSDTTTVGSVVDRQDTMTVAFEESFIHPFGLGAGAFGALPQFKADIPLGGYQTVNNLYLEVLVEEGFLGLILLVLFLVYYMLALAREGGENKLFLIISFGLISALLIQYLFFSTLYIMYIWVVLAIVSPKTAKMTKS